MRSVTAGLRGGRFGGPFAFHTINRLALGGPFSLEAAIPDLAELGLRVRSEEAEVAEHRLDDLAMAAGRAESAEERLAAAARGTGSALSTQNVAIVQQQRVLMASRNAMGLTAQEGLNLSRQFADIGVTAAMGMNPLMIALQQGPQLFDIFQMAAIRSGTSIRASMAATGAAIWTAMAPLLPIIAALAAAGATVAAAWGLATRSIGKNFGDVAAGMNLTKEQMERLRDNSIETGVTMGDVWRGFGTTVKEVLQDVFGTQLDWIGKQWTAFLDMITGFAAKTALGIGTAFLGTFYAIRDTWKMLPAVVGDAAVTAANAVIRAVENMINASSAGLNKLIDLYNAGAGVLNKPILPNIPEVKLGQIAETNAGAVKDAGKVVVGAYEQAGDDIEKAAGGFWRRLNQNVNASAQARIGKAAGDAKKARDAGKSDAEREYDRLMKSGEAYRLGLIKEREELGMTAMERRAYEAQAQADILIKRGQTDAARALAKQILDEAKALNDATAAYERAEVMKGFGRDLQYLELERDLLGATNVERARQLAMLQQEFIIRDRLGTQADAYLASAEGQAEVGMAGKVGAKRVENGEALSEAQKVSRELRLIDDLARDAGRGMADAFGEAGAALSDLLIGLTSYRVAMDDIARRQHESQIDATQAARERAAVEVQTYGDMAGAAKGFFKEGSDGYRILAAIEMAYRLQQFALAVQAIAMGKTEAASSVADSAAKGAASIASGAAKMFEALGPWAFPAVAAMIALLASLGLKGKGGGGGGNSAVSDSVVTAQTYSDQSQQAQAGASASVAQAVTVTVVPNDERFDAYVDGRAAPMAVGAAKTVYDQIQTDQQRAIKKSKYAVTHGRPR